jgi:hypothetical protein
VCVSGRTCSGVVLSVHVLESIDRLDSNSFLE